MRRTAKMLRISMLIAALVIAQTAALIHSDREDSHPANDVCALCVGLAGLGAGNVAAPQTAMVVVQTAEPVDYLLTHAVVRRIEHRFARGPPQAS